MEDILSKSWEEEVEEENWFKDWWEVAEMELELEKKEENDKVESRMEMIGRWKMEDEKMKK